VPFHGASRQRLLSEVAGLGRGPRGDPLDCSRLYPGSVGEPTGAFRVLTIIGPTVITLWLLSMGIMLLRKVRETPIRAVETDAQDAA